jgi:hypothetical protein
MRVGRPSSVRAFDHSILAKMGNYLAEVFYPFGWVRNVFTVSLKPLPKVFRGKTAFHMGKCSNCPVLIIDAPV